MGQKYRFVGTSMEIGPRRLSKFGEEITLTPEQRKDAGPNAPLVHDALFSKAAFTEQELSIYANPGQRIDAPEAFMSKVRVVWALVGQEPSGNPALAQVEAKMSLADRSVVDAAIQGVKQ
jgi:hypothetical protein